MFNQKAVLAKRQRAGRINREGADFLLKLAIEDICDRLSVTNRQFDHAIEIEPLAKPSPLQAFLNQRTGNYRSVSVLPVEHPSKDGQPMQLEENSCDLIIAALSLHWHENIPAVFMRFFRALRPDGLLMAAFPGEDTLNELRDALILAETEISGGITPRVDPFPAINDLGMLLSRSGFALPVVDQERFVVRYHDMFALVADLRAMGVASSLAHNTARAKRRVFDRAAEIYQEKYSDGDGRIRATFNISHLSGWKPHDSQQKPLKRGSAVISLKDVL